MGGGAKGFPDRDADYLSAAGDQWQVPSLSSPIVEIHAKVRDPLAPNITYPLVYSPLVNLPEAAALLQEYEYSINFINFK